MALDIKYNDVNVRDDSERNPLNGTDEPVFVLRAQDVFSSKILVYYSGLMLNNPHLTGAQRKIMLERIEEVVKVFHDWQTSHPERVKFPD